MPYDKTLQFNALTDILFSPSADDIKITVSGTPLGAINKNYPVTIFISENSGNKYITLKEIIPNSDYTAGNNNDHTKDTVGYNYADIRHNLRIEMCAGTPNRYKIVGWEEDQIGQTCTGSAGSISDFEITSELNFKAKIEEVAYPNNILKWRMVVRYTSNIKTKVAAASALCYSDLYCYSGN